MGVKQTAKQPTMKAVVFDGKLRLADVPKPVPRKGEALVRVSMTGICNTDLEIIKGYLGFRGIIGHEFAGVVEAVSGRSGRLVGKRVIGEINCGCLTCDFCRSGLERHCPARTTMGILGRPGAFAEFVTLPARNLHIIPDNVADEEAVFTEPLAAAFEILEQVTVTKKDKVLVLGDGKLGILCALTLKLTGADVTLAGRHAAKLSIAARQGIREILAKDLTRPAGGFDIVVEATGAAEAMEKAMELTRPRGIIVLKTTVAAAKPINLAPVVINELTIVGSRCGLFPPALKALSAGKVDVSPLISAIYHPSQAMKAFRTARSKNTLKVLIDFGGR